jgi:hypothetical protein
MDNTDDNYISLFNQSTNLTADNDTIKSNINNQLFINSVNTSLIKFNNSLKLLGSSINNSTIETVLTNDYIVNNSINQEKIYGLTTDLTNIINKFLDYYTKIESNNLYYNKTYIDTLISLYYTKVQIDNLIALYYTKTESNNLFYNKSYIDNLISLYYTKVQSDAKYALISSLSNYYTKSESDNLYYNKLYIDSFFYNKTYIDNLITSYYTKTQSDNLFYNKSYIDNLISFYVTNSSLTTTLLNYVTNSSLTTTLSAYVTNNSLTTTLTSYYTKTAADNLFYTKTATDNLLFGKVGNVTYNTDQANLALKFFSPLSSGNLRKAYLEYADLTSTKYILFSQNGTNQYQTIDFLDNNIIPSAKLINNSIGLTQLDSNLSYAFAYFYDNLLDQTTGLMKLSGLNIPGSAGTYYLRSFLNNGGLNQISWVDISTLNNNPTITLPYTIISSQSGYGSADTCAFKIIQQTNRTTSTGAGFTVSHSDNVSLYTAQFGYNSSGRFPTVSPNFIQYQNPYAYIYSTNDIFLFCKSTVNNNISVRIQCMSNPDMIYFSSNCGFQNWDLMNCRAIYVSNIYPNTTNASYVQVNSDLQCPNIFKCDTLQGYSAVNLIKFNNNTNHNNNNINNVGNIYVSTINANTTNNTEIRFNNTINVNSNLIKNYNLDSQTFLKTTSGNITQQLTLANTFCGWGLGAIGGANFCQFGLYEPTTQPSTSLTRYSYIQTGAQAFQIGNSTLTYCNFSYSTTQSTVDFKNSLLKIDNIVNSTGSNPINIGALNCIGQLNMNNNAIINCPSLGGSITGSNSISVNTGGFNFLTQTNTTKSGVIIYGMSANSFFHENQNSESAGFGCNGFTDDCTIWTAGDTGSICNFQDEDSANSRVGYVNTSGVLVAVSSQTRKHSIRTKNNNNVLERILKLNVKSYGYKYEFNDDDNEKKKQRMTNKSKKQQLGLILEEVYDILPNCCSFYDNSLDDNLIDDDNIKNKDVTFKNKPKLQDVNDISNNGINYTNILLYFIMAFQDYVKSNQNTNNNDLIIKNNIYINDKLDEFDVRLKNTESNVLRPDEVYRIKNIINTQDDIYKTINNDIKKVQLSNDILRDKYIDNVESNIIIQNSLKDEIKELKNEIAILKDDNTKFKLALKMVMDKLNKKV